MRAPPPGIELASVESWVLAALPELRGPLRFEKVGRGRSNLTYRVSGEGGSGTVILRRPPLGALVESAHNLGREYGVLRALAERGYRVPRPLAHCEDPAVTGADFFLMEEVAGVVADSPAAVEAGLSAAARGRSAGSLAAALAELHAIDASSGPLAEIGRGADHAGRQLRRWSRQWELTKTRELPALTRLTERLGASVPEQTAVALVHGDYTLFNTVLDPDGEVRAVLDWELCTRGEPISDLAWCLMWWPDEQAAVAPGAEPVPLMDGFADQRALIDAYVEASGRSVEALGWWRVLSYWKLAVILEGIVHRWRQDPENGGEDPAALVPGVERLVSLAEASAEQAGL